MTIHFYTFSDDRGGSSRQRAFRVVEELQKRGIDAVIKKPPIILLSRTHWPKKLSLILEVLRSLLSIKKGDIVYLQRVMVNKYFFVIMVAYILLFRPKVIFDFDDPVYVFNYWKTRIFSKLAHAVVVCTHGQKEWAKQFNKNVHIIHIALDSNIYKKYTKDYSKNETPLVIGWVGTGPEHIENLKILSRVFESLLKSAKTAFKFRLIGSVGDKNVYELFQKIKGLNVEFVDSLNWSNSESAPREIQNFDIGVIPHLSSGPWNQSKSSFKILEYMGCGVATVCSRFGEMPYIIEDGVSGFLVSNEEEWVARLNQLLDDKNLRAKLGRQGQIKIENEYSFNATIPKLIKIINSL